MNKKGFTLIEMIVVLAIMGILLSIAVPQMALMKDKKYTAFQKKDVRNIKNAEFAYFDNNAQYTANIEELKLYGCEYLHNTNRAAITSTDLSTNFTVAVDSDETNKIVTYYSTSDTTVITTN